MISSEKNEAPPYFCKTNEVLHYFFRKNAFFSEGIMIPGSLWKEACTLPYFSKNK
jgi:hypothetical protein